MKKIIFSAAVALMAGAMLSSCGKGDAEAAGSDTLASKAVSDSACYSFGMMAGAQISHELQQYQEYTGQGYDRSDFYKGLHSVVAGNHAEAYIAGVSSGLQVIQTIRQMEALGVQVNRDVLLQAMRAMIVSDSVASDIDAMRYYQQFNQIMMGLQKAKEERQAAAVSEDPAAVQNRKTGEAFVNRLKAENPDFKVTEDGLGYIIANPGDANRPGADATVTVNYKGTLLDGKEFDHGDGVKFPLANVVPGFRQAVMMLGVGGEGTFYIPGKLAYGVKGAPDAGIGPDQMLVFEVKLVSIDGAEK